MSSPVFDANNPEIAERPTKLMAATRLPSFPIQHISRAAESGLRVPSAVVDGASSDSNVSPAVTFVREYLDTRHIRANCDNSFVNTNAPMMADGYDDVHAYLGRPRLTYKTVLDNMLDLNSPRATLKPADIKTAFAIEVSRRQHSRFQETLSRLIVQGGPSTDEWQKYAQAFDMDGELFIAVKKHFIWQVFRKLLGRPVAHHLMPIIYSAKQGTGKSMLVRKFLSPFEELGSATATLSDIADKRGIGFYEYPVVLIDDVDGISGSRVEILKQVVTSDVLRRRILGTNRTETVRQRATFIGTANKDIKSLISDPTGHRRYVLLPFRDGAADSNVREIVKKLDALALWQSVNPFVDSPIEQFLEPLREHQNRTQSDSPLHAWLRDLDMNSDSVRRILESGRVGARDLYDLMQAQTDIVMEEKTFSKQMRWLVRFPDTPFDSKSRRAGGVYYSRRAGA